MHGFPLVVGSGVYAYKFLKRQIRWYDVSHLNLCVLLWDVGLLLPVAGTVEAELIDALGAQHPLLADAPPTSSVSQETEAAVCSRVACSFPKTLNAPVPAFRKETA